MFDYIPEQLAEVQEQYNSPPISYKATYSHGNERQAHIHGISGNAISATGPAITGLSENGQFMKNKSI